MDIEVTIDVGAVRKTGQCNCLYIMPGDVLQEKYDWLKSADRNSAMGALSASNWRWVILSPGTYTDALTMDTDYVGVVALNKHRDSAVLSTTPTITATTHSLLGITCTDTGQYYSGNVKLVAATGTPLDTKVTADYVCDGTQDDVQIQAAIDSLPAAGGEVLLLAGEYSVYSTITIPGSVTLRGVGPSTILKLADGRNTSTLKNDDWTNGDDDIVIKDIKFDGNVTNNPSTGTSVGMLYFKKADRVKLTGLVCTAASRVGIQIEDTKNAHVINNDIGSAFKDCLAFNEGCLDCLVQGNMIHDSGTGNSGVEVQDASKRIVIQGNVIYDCSRGVEISSHTTACESVTIRGNSIKDAGRGIVISGTTPSLDVAQVDITISGNLISDTTGSTDPRYALQSNNTNGLIFCDNQVVSPLYGFLCTVSTVDTIISNNHFVVRNAGADTGRCFQFQGEVTRMLISNNMFVDFEYRCIGFHANCIPTDVRILDNQLINVKRSGSGQAFDFDMTGDVSTRCLIKGNYLDASVYSGNAAAALNSLPDGWMCDSISVTGVEAKTANFTIHHFLNGTTFTNEGTSGSVEFTLPAAQAGMKYKFVKIVDQDVLLTPAGSDTIDGAADMDDTTSETNKFIVLECFVDGNWITTASDGTWA